MEQDEQAEILGRLFHADDRTRVRDWVGAVYLLAVIAWIVVLVRIPLPSLSLLTLQDPDQLRPWLQSLVGRCLLQLGIFFLLGVVLPLSIAALRRRWQQRVDAEDEFVRRAAPHRESHHRHPGPLRRSMLARIGSGLRAVVRFLAGIALLIVTPPIAIAAGVALTALFLDLGWYSLAVDTAVAWFACCLGWWVCWWWQRGWPGLAALAVQGGVLLAVAALGYQWLGDRLFESKPHVLEPVTISAAEKRVLMEKLRAQADYDRVAALRTYRVSSDDLDKLLAWWTALTQIGVSATTDLHDDGSTLLVSLDVPTWGEDRRYLNTAVWGKGSISDGTLQLELAGVRFGELLLPRRISRWGGTLATRWINTEPDNVALLKDVKSAQAGGEGVEVTVAAGGMGAIIRKLGNQPDLTQAVRRQLVALVDVAREQPPGDARFNAMVNAAFERARQESMAGEAVLANRAAVLALGIVLGHPEVEKLVGRGVTDPPLAAQVRLLPGTGSVHGRQDLARHFWVSAALTIMTTGHVSDAFGVLKEQLDSDGGSGFSFADLLADRAGTEFGKQAAGNESSARAVQEWVHSAEVDQMQQLMPSADGLPEGLSAQAMQVQFDGVGGARYLQMEQEIEGRIRKKF